MCCDTVGVDALARHLTAHYDVIREAVARLDEDVFRVEGPSWVARRFPPDSCDAEQIALQARRSVGA